MRQLAVQQDATDTATRMLKQMDTLVADLQEKVTVASVSYEERTRTVYASQSENLKESRMRLEAQVSQCLSSIDNVIRKLLIVGP